MLMQLLLTSAGSGDYNLANLIWKSTHRDKAFHYMPLSDRTAQVNHPGVDVTGADDLKAKSRVFCLGKEQLRNVSQHASVLNTTSNKPLSVDVSDGMRSCT
jgi:hypothetical protein